MFADGHLIPVRYLLNGATIRQDTVAKLTYWLIELARHAVLLAAGLPAESYLNAGNRSAFANGGLVPTLHPDFARATWDARGCAPLATEGPVLEAVRGRTVEQAMLSRWRMTDRPDVTIDVDGRRREVAVDGTALHRAIAGHGRTRGAALAKLRPFEHGLGPDTRRLGIAVMALVLDGAPFVLDDCRLSDGWHSAEPRLRWTSGQATLTVQRARHLVVRIAPPLGRYWITPPHDPWVQTAA